MNIQHTFTKAQAGLCSEEHYSSHICKPTFLKTLLHITVSATPDFTYKNILYNSTQCSERRYSNLLQVGCRAFQFNVLQFISFFIHHIYKKRWKRFPSTHITSNKHAVRCISQVHKLSKSTGSDEQRFQLQNVSKHVHHFSTNTILCR
jgi:hypothetical protein